MKPGHILTIARAAFSMALLASAALFIDYQRPGDPAFCGVESSCMTVRRSDVGQEIAAQLMRVAPGMNLPMVGLFASLILLAFTFFLKTRFQLWVLAAFTSVGGLFALYLIRAQMVIGSYCPHCMVVDVSMIVASASMIALAVMFHPRGPAAATAARIEITEPSFRRATDVRTTFGWGFGGALLVALPFILARYPVIPENPPLPAAIAELQAGDKPVVVTFTDFQCPHCRRLHIDTHDELAKRGVVIKRLMVPLAGHPGARPAALGYLCAPADKREEMAHALYTAKNEDLTYSGVSKIIEDLGFAQGDAIAECFHNAESKATIEADGKLFDETGGEGLPTTWVGANMIRGALGHMVISSLDRTTAANPIQIPGWVLYFAGSLVIVGIVGFSWARPMSANEDGKPSTNGEINVPGIGGSDDESEESSDEDEKSSSEDKKPTAPEREATSDRPLKSDPGPS
jgi:uncharacterized membrane protein